MDDDALRWAEAPAIERLRGRDGPRWLAERIATLALAGDSAGVERFRAIASRYQDLLATGRPNA